jgi:acid stress chaperone HdeA
VKHSLVAVLAVALLAGCSGASNSGGDTTCRDFLTMRQDDMDATVAKLLKARNGRNSSTTDVINTRIGIVAACSPADKGDVKIGDVG